MPIFVILIIFSLIFYFYYKVKGFRTNNQNEKKWISAKSSIALGAFVGLFGLNRLFITQTSVSIIVGVLFIAVGTLAIWTGYKAYKYYLPHVISEQR